MSSLSFPVSTDPMIADAVRIILEGQHPSGAYVASPNFSQYHFGWLRDGSFVAMAMDAVDERKSSRAFHRWVAGVVRAHAGDVAVVIAARNEHREPKPEHLLPTRYELDGQRETVAEESWPNFQLDGYGTWLFALEQHLGADDAGPFTDSIRLVADYLSVCWAMPCYDYWEEFGDRLHTSTLAAIAAGLGAAARMLRDQQYSRVAAAVEDFIRTECVRGGSFVKGPEDDRVDASLISLSTPFALVADDDPVMVRTVQRIRAELSSPSGGIRRYVGDTYFGGNPWVLLTAWMGWHLRKAGDVAGYEQLRDWVRGNVGAQGALPEQTTTEPQPGAEAYVDEWTRRWGAVADPLLWSHAKYALMERGA